MTETEPAPGSREAIARGCTCSSVLNRRAREPCTGNRPSIARRTARCTGAPRRTTKS